MAGFLFIIVIAAVVTGYSGLRLLDIRSKTEDLHNDQVPGVYLSGQILQHIRQSDGALLRSVVAEDPATISRAIEEMNESSKANAVCMAEREKLISAGKERVLFDTIKQKRESYLAMRDGMISQIKEGKGKEALVAYEKKGVPTLLEYTKALDALEQNDKEDAFGLLGNITGCVHAASKVLMVGGLLCLVVCLGVAYAVVKMLGATLKSLMLAIIQVNGSATEMSATLKEQQASANEVASTSVEIGATAKEISATTKELGKTMSDVAGVSEATAELAAGGQAGLSRLEGTMRQIMGATTSISGKLAILNEKTANINSMVTTINKVADQTNLLSLNAAIEAEKAGEHGQGFAVVATEIRRLADQTAVATYDIEQMVKEMQSAVSAGVMGMDKFAEEVRRGNEEVCGVTAQLVQIIQQVQALTPRFESVNEGMQMQSTAAGQISDALTQLGDTAQQSAQALRQNSEAIDQLMKAAQGLQTASSQLRSRNG